MALTAEVQPRLARALKSEDCAKQIIDELNAVAAITPGSYPSSAGATQLGSNTTDINTIVGLEKLQASNAVTAFATGGQTSATALTGMINRISTCATAGDSVKLPASAAGLEITVINDGAAGAQIFGAGTDTINSVATATGVPQMPGTIVTYRCTAAGNWRAISPGTTEASTTISTVGAGTLTAAGLVGGIILRSGSTAAYTDTTATAAQIVAAVPVAYIGKTFRITIQNTVAFAETLAAGTGVTLAGLTVIPPLSVGEFLVSVTSLTAVTITGLSMQPLCNLPYSKFTTSAAASPLAAAAGDLTGAGFVTWQNTTNGVFGLTTRTATQMFGDIPNAQVGMEYVLCIVSQGDNTITITAGTGVTITGTATIATKTTRFYNVKFTASTTLTMTSFSKGTIE